MDNAKEEYQLSAGDEHYFMDKALNLAIKGAMTTHPNPCVGCVIVRNGEVVGKGWHRFAGKDHAEIVALKQAGDKTIGATMYVTLEPCSHYGRTPPCVQAIIKSRVHRVVIATEDPNPLVNRGGILALQHAGIQVSHGPGKQKAKDINKGFFKRVTTGIPWVTLKTAISLDGRIAMVNGESKWITSNVARLDSHKIRATSAAVLTGVGTILRDNPTMNVRLKNIQRQPLRVILDSHLNTPVDSKVLRAPGNVLIMTIINEGNNPKLLESKYVEVFHCPSKNGGIDLDAMMKELGRREINSVMLEAGSRLNGSMLQQGFVDEMVVYIAPDLLGSDARHMFQFKGLESLADKIKLEFKEVKEVGRDIKLTLSTSNR